MFDGFTSIVVVFFFLVPLTFFLSGSLHHSITVFCLKFVGIYRVDLKLAVPLCLLTLHLFYKDWIT